MKNDPMLEPARDAVRRLRRQAEDLEWEGRDPRRAAFLRAQAREIEDSGVEYLPLF